MIDLTWYEFNGKKKKLPKNLIYRPVNKGCLDMRFKVNKDFVADKRWKHRNPVFEMWQPRISEWLNAPSILDGFKEAKTVKFKRYTALTGGKESNGQ